MRWLHSTWPGSTSGRAERGGIGALDACSLLRVQPDTLVTVRVVSPYGTYVGEAVTIHADVFPTGSPPGPYGPSPELHFAPAGAPGGAWVAASTSSLPAGGLTARIPVRPWMVGRTLLLQAVAQAPSAETGNPITATDAHEVRTGKVPYAKAW